MSATIPDMLRMLTKLRFILEEEIHEYGPDDKINSNLIDEINRIIDPPCNQTTFVEETAEISNAAWKAAGAVGARQRDHFVEAVREHEAERKASSALPSHQSNCAPTQGE